MRLITIIAIILVYACSFKGFEQIKNCRFNYTLELKELNENQMLYLYLENTSNDTLLLTKHSLYCGTMPIYIYTLQDSIIGRLGFSSDCMDEEVLPYNKDTTFVSIYELISYGSMTRNYQFQIGKPYKVKLRERNCIKSNEIIFDYNPPIVKKEKPKFGKFNYRHLPGAFQVFAELLDDDVEVDSLYLGTYFNGVTFHKEEMNSKRIVTEKKDSIFTITFPDNLVYEVTDSSKMDSLDLYFIQFFLKDVGKSIQAYFLPKYKNQER